MANPPVRSNGFSSPSPVRSNGFSRSSLRSARGSVGQGRADSAAMFEGPCFGFVFQGNSPSLRSARAAPGTLRLRLRAPLPLRPTAAKTARRNRRAPHQLRDDLRPRQTTAGSPVAAPLVLRPAPGRGRGSPLPLRSPPTPTRPDQPRSVRGANPAGIWGKIRSCRGLQRAPIIMPACSLWGSQAPDPAAAAESSPKSTRRAKKGT